MRERRKLDRRPARRQSAWLHRQFEAAAVHCLSHRRAAPVVVRQLTDCDAACVFRPYFTHAKLAAVRGVQHRNTSRDIVTELAKVGLIRLIGYRPGRPRTHGGFQPYRFVIRHGAVRSYIAENADAQPLHNREGVAARTIDAWGQAMKEHIAGVEEAQARLDVVRATRVVQERAAFARSRGQAPGGWLETSVHIAKTQPGTPGGRFLREHFGKLCIGEDLIDRITEAELCDLIRQRRAEQAAVAAQRPQASSIESLRAQAAALKVQQPSP